MASEFRSRLVLCAVQVNPALLTHSLFDRSYREPKGSAIDEFLRRVEAANRLAPRPTDFDAFQGQLVLLGAVAAVESYIRTLFRRLIAADKICQEAVEHMDVSFGAAMHLTKDLLPEAILERISFLSHSNISESIRTLLAVKGALSPELETAIEDYVRVCQLRHCAVHRFGKLGVNNAIQLGLENHKALLEKPLLLNYRALQDAIAIATSFVKTLNNFLFNALLSRVPHDQWTGLYSKDRQVFGSYYLIFADRVSVRRTPAAGKVYREFRKQQMTWLQTNGHKYSGNRKPRSIA
jgi:hypothetical protein